VATPATVVSAEEYERIALAESNRGWELRDGQLVETPPMAIGHAWAQSELVYQLRSQLDPKAYWVQFAAKAKRDDRHYYIPDVCVVPMSLVESDRSEWRKLNLSTVSLPLVVEIWSPSTGDYDVDEKLPEYRRRGEQEIWRLHPFDRTLTVWRRQADGSYVETLHRGGTVSPAAFPWVTIDLGVLFA
jgi:Uma2 family endonuclease